MMVDANAFVMLGRQACSGGAHGGGAEMGAGTTVMPLKKRKWEKRGSFEASAARNSLEAARHRLQRQVSLGGSHATLDSGRVSGDHLSRPARRPSFEVRTNRGSLEFEARPLSEAPNAEASSTATVTEVADDTEMGTIQEASEMVVDLDGHEKADEKARSGATFDAGRLLSQLFGSGNKPRCIRVKGDDNEGFVVNKRFMAVVSKREQNQKQEMERLRQENLALRNANQTLSQKMMGVPHYAVPQAQSQPVYAAPAFMQSSLYATQPQMQQVPQPQFVYATAPAGPAWQYAPQ